MKELKDGRYLADGFFGEIRKSTNPPLHSDIDSNHLPGIRPSVDLDGLADRLSAIARELRRVPLALDNTADRSTAPHHPFDEFRIEAAADPDISIAPHNGNERQIRAAMADVAREIYTQRRRRVATFGNPDLFGEPAWDILLDLYIAEADGKTVSVSSACIGSAAPPTTGLRWLGVLAENDLILREHDPQDQRRVLVRLTDRGLAAMDQFFSGM